MAASAPRRPAAAARRRRSGRGWRLVLAAVAAGGLAWWLAASGGRDDAPASREPAPPTAVLELVPRVVAIHPHDPEASTQGLVWFEGRLYESTGLYGRSTLRRVALESGRVEQRVDLEATLFGEGLERVGRELVQLTWRSGLALVWDLDSLAPRGEHRYAGEGWGLCYDGEQLWRSDGSPRLARHGAADFSALGALEVTLDGAPRDRLNELECAEGWIYANVFQSDEIVRIDPASGVVRAVIDAAELFPAAARGPAGVLNGIAYRPETETFLLTGKRWPRLYEVVFAARPVS